MSERSGRAMSEEAARLAYQLADVRHDYGPTRALELDRFDIRSNRVTCLLGPTGAGKSTLLRLLAGVLPPSHGRVTWDLSDDPPHCCAMADRRRVSLLFQRPLALRRSVRDNVAYGLKLRGIPADERDDRVDQILRQLELVPVADRRADRLSGGQLQLVALARTLVLRPTILLLDEPTMHLDPPRVALVEHVLLEDHRSRRHTIVWATHQLFQAKRVANDVALLFDGRCIECGPAGDFFQHPRDPRTRAFLDGKLVW